MYRVCVSCSTVCAELRGLASWVITNSTPQHWQLWPELIPLQRNIQSTTRKGHITRSDGFHGLRTELALPCKPLVSSPDTSVRRYKMSTAVIDSFLSKIYAKG
jgi:hypothetical protein